MDRNHDRCRIRIGLPCRRLTKNSLDAVIILVQTGKKQPDVDWKTKDIYYINPLTSRPGCMPGSRYTGVGVLFFVI